MSASPSFPPGRVITFYSFKGGVGRTFALADVAILLARWGWRVLCVDWDLEAPGLDAYLREWTPAEPCDGILEYLESVGAGTPTAPAAVPVTVRDTADRLWLVRAGRRDGTYTDRVQKLSWDALYDAGLFAAIEAQRTAWQAEYDFVLVDSRTGVNDIGAICAVQLPDILVALFTPNRQSYAGVTDVLNRVAERQAGLPVDRAPLRVVPVLSRLENSEYRDRLDWTSKVTGEMAHWVAAWEPGSTVDPKVLEHIAVPHVGYFSYDERLAVVIEESASPGTVGFAHANLAGLLANNLMQADRLISRRARYVPESAAVLGKIGGTSGELEAALRSRKSGGFQGHPNGADAWVIRDPSGSLAGLWDMLGGNDLFLLVDSQERVDWERLDVPEHAVTVLRGPFRSAEAIVSRMLMGA